MVDPEGWADYDEATDEYYCPEGWYEETNCEICEVGYRQYTGSALTGWMPLPEVPDD